MTDIKELLNFSGGGGSVIDLYTDGEKIIDKHKTIIFEHNVDIQREDRKPCLYFNQSKSSYLELINHIYINEKEDFYLFIRSKIISRSGEWCFIFAIMNSAPNPTEKGMFSLSTNDRGGSLNISAERLDYSGYDDITLNYNIFDSKWHDIYIIRKYNKIYAYVDSQFLISFDHINQIGMIPGTSSARCLIGGCPNRENTYYTMYLNRIVLSKDPIRIDSKYLYSYDNSIYGII